MYSITLHGNYSQLYCIIYLKIAKRVGFTSLHKKNFVTMYVDGC